MTHFSRLVALSAFILVGCGDEQPGLWANTYASEYADYCTIEYCDMIETSAEPECTCPCKDDSDGCEGPNCPDGGDGSPECDGGDCPDGGDGGCTLTQGYWKNHNEFRTQPKQAKDWPAPYDEVQQLCGRGLLDILNTPTRGDAWYILAHQYIAASLNVAAGAAPDDIAAALARSKALLEASCSGIGAQRQTAIDLSYLLDSYNNGLIGPGHCGG